MLVALYQREAGEPRGEPASDGMTSRPAPTPRPVRAVVQQPSRSETHTPTADSPAAAPSMQKPEAAMTDDDEPRPTRLWDLRLPSAADCPELWQQLNAVEYELCLQGSWEVRGYLRDFVLRWYAKEEGPEPSEAICTLYLRAILQQPLVTDSDLQLYGTWMSDARAVLERLSGGGPILDAEVMKAREHWRTHGKGRRYVNLGHGQGYVTNGGDVFDRYTARCARQIFDDTARLRWWIEQLRSKPDGPADLLHMAIAADTADANSKPRSLGNSVLLWLNAETEPRVATCDACMDVVADHYNRRVSTLGFDCRGLATKIESRDRPLSAVGLNRFTTPTPAVGVWSWNRSTESPGGGVQFLFWNDRILVWPTEARLSGVLSAFVELELITSADYFNHVPAEAPAPLRVMAEFTP